MKRVTLLLTALLLLATAGAATAQSLAYTDVTVIDVAEGVAEPGMTVVVTGDRITGVGRTDSLEVPADAAVIDAAGKYLIPGLWDMHVHLDDPEMWHRHLSLEAKETLLSLLVVHGIAGVRDMGSGLDQVNEWRRRAADGELFAPRVIAAGPFLDGTPAVWPASIGLEGPEAAREAARMLARRDGVDFLKVYAKLPRDAYFVIAEEAKRLGIPFGGHLPFSVRPEEAVEAGQRSFEHLDGLLYRCTAEAAALEREVRVAADRMEEAEAGFRPPQESSADLVEAGVRVYQGVDPRVVEAFDPEHCQPFLRMLAEAGTWQVPTLTVYEGYFLTTDTTRTDPRLQYLPGAYLTHWREERSLPPRVPPDHARSVVESRIRMTGALHAAGVPLMAGSDMAALAYTFPGSSLHDELALLVRAGLTPAEALRTATLNPARYLGRDYELGSVEFGKLADLVLLDANPLEDIANTRRIRAVVLNGRLLDRDTLDSMLAEVECVVQE